MTTLAAPAVWLRDNCPCTRCRHPGSGQKLLGLDDLPADLRVVEVRDVGERVHVTFAPDGHEAVFDRAWLAARSALDGPPRDVRTEDAKRTWDRVPEANWGDDPVQALDAVLHDGVVLLRGVPPRDGMVLEVARSFGHVRTTNYGDLFDVRVVPDPINLAFTALPIAPHTDNPYRDPVPTLQLLHCLRNAAEGGDSGLVDGFRAAAVLRAEDPSAFAVLTGTAVTFAFASADARLSATRPMIGVDPYGRIREIRFNHRSLQPVGLPDAERFYGAYRAFAAVLNRPELLRTLAMGPGDCLVFDNTRVLHARTAFRGDAGGPPGERQLQGCYADIDGLASTLAVLRGNDG